MNVSRIRRAVASMAACTTIVATAVAAAATTPVTTTVTKHYFSVQVYSRISDSSGARLPTHFMPVAGDRISYADNDYVGTQKHHAKRATASDHTLCTITGSNSVLCDGALAIGGALILADDYLIDFPSTKKVTTIKITGGTGRYRGARGTVTATIAGKGLNVTIKVSA